MDDATKTAVQEIISTALGGLKADIEAYVATSIAGSESKFELRVKSLETTKQPGSGDDKGGNSGTSELENKVAELTRQLEQRDIDTLRSTALSQYTKAATDLKSTAPTAIAELLLNRSKADDYNTTSGGALTLGSKPLETVVKDFLNSNEGVPFRQTKDVDPPGTSANDKPAGDKGGSADKAALDKAWEGFTSSFA
jgi:hypothetical protein